MNNDLDDLEKLMDGEEPGPIEPVVPHTPEVKETDGVEITIGEEDKKLAEPEVKEEIKEEVKEEPNVIETVVNEEVKEEPEAPVIVKTEDGISISIGDTKEEDATEVYTGIVMYKEEDINKRLTSGLNFEKSDFKATKSDTDNPVTLLNMLKYQGEYMDIYLPVSNIGVRVYEFDNELFLENSLTSILTLDADKRAGVMPRSQLTRSMLNQIRRNCVILTGDSAEVTNSFTFDNLSNNDIAFLLLGTAALMAYSANNKAGYSFLLNIACETCTARNRSLHPNRSEVENTVSIDINLDLKKVLKDQYEIIAKNKYGIPDLEVRMNNYDTNAPLSKLIKDSFHNAAFKTSKDVGNDKVTVVVKDPGYAAYRSHEDRMYSYLLEKYKNEIAPVVKDISGFNTMPIYRQMSMVVAAVKDGRMGYMSSNEIGFDIMRDYGLVYVTMYIDTLIFTDTVKNTAKSINMKEQTPESQLDTVRSLDKELIKKITTAISMLQDKGTQGINIDIKCSNCGQTTHIEGVEPIDLFFSIVEQTLSKTDILG